jgi:ribosomal protein L30
MTPRARKEKKQGLLRITQVRSRIGNPKKVAVVLTRGLGLGRIGKSVILPDNPYTRG